MRMRWKYSNGMSHAEMDVGEFIHWTVEQRGSNEYEAILEIGELRRTSIRGTMGAGQAWLFRETQQVLRETLALFEQNKI